MLENVKERREIFTYANGEAVDRPPSISALGVALTIPRVALVAIKAKHFAFEERNNEAIHESRRVARSVSTAGASSLS
jgi:hypothetical protein